MLHPDTGQQVLLPGREMEGMLVRIVNCRRTREFVRSREGAGFDQVYTLVRDRHSQSIHACCDAWCKGWYLYNQENDAEMWQIAEFISPSREFFHLTPVGFAQQKRRGR